MLVGHFFPSGSGYGSTTLADINDNFPPLLQKLRINPRGAVAGPPKTFSWTSTPKNSPRCRASPSPPPPPRREILTQHSSTPTAYPSVSCLCHLTIYRCQVVIDERFIQSTFYVVSYSESTPRPLHQSLFLSLHFFMV